MSVLSRDGPRGQPALRPARDRLGARHRRLPSPAQARTSSTRSSSARAATPSPTRQRATSPPRRRRAHAQPLARPRRADEGGDAAEERAARTRRRPGAARTSAQRRAARRRAAPTLAQPPSARASATTRARPRAAARGRSRRRRRASARSEQAVEGVLEILANGSGFIRLNAPDASDDDVYISAAQVRRCELVSGDRVGGPARRARRSERHPSLVRVETINGTAAEEVSDGTRYDDLGAAFPSAPIAFKAKDATLKQIADLAPIGRGSRVTVSGAPGSGRTTTLRLLAIELAAEEGIEVQRRARRARARRSSAEWTAAELEPAAVAELGQSPDAQAQAIDRVVDSAKRDRRARRPRRRRHRLARPAHARAAARRVARRGAQRPGRRHADDHRRRARAGRRGDDADPRSTPTAAAQSAARCSTPRASRCASRRSSGRARRRRSPRRAQKALAAEQRRRLGRGRSSAAARRPRCGACRRRAPSSARAPARRARRRGRAARRRSVWCSQSKRDVELALLDALVEPGGAEDQAPQPVHERAVGGADELGPAVVDVLAEAGGRLLDLAVDGEVHEVLELALVERAADEAELARRPARSARRSRAR